MTIPSELAGNRRLLLNVKCYLRALGTSARWQLILAASGWVTLLGTLMLPASSPPQVILVFGFSLICPGLAVSRLLPTKKPVEGVVLAVALSISFGILVTVTLTVVAIDSVVLGLGLLALITTVAALVDVRPIPKTPVPKTGVDPPQAERGAGG